MKRSKRPSPLDGLDLDDEDRPLSCPNCGTERQGTYCHECGQRYMRARLTAWELWWLFADRFLDWEEGVWRTFLKMATGPGVVIQHYLGGKRKTYLNPFSYVLFCAALYALGQFVMRRIAGMRALPGLEDVQEFGMALNNVEDQFTLIAYGTVLAVALMAVAMRIMFDGRLLNAMEAIVTALYASGNVFVLSLLFSVIEMSVSGTPLSPRGLLITFGILFPFCVGHAGALRRLGHGLLHGHDAHRGRSRWYASLLHGDGHLFRWRRCLRRRRYGKRHVTGLGSRRFGNGAGPGVGHVPRRAVWVASLDG